MTPQNISAVRVVHCTMTIDDTTGTEQDNINGLAKNNNMAEGAA